jgi:hypothetical protein
MVLAHPGEPAASLRSWNRQPGKRRLSRTHRPPLHATAKNTNLTAMLAEIRTPDIELRSDAPRERARDEAWTKAHDSSSTGNALTAFSRHSALHA